MVVRSPYEFDLIDDCLTCPVRHDRLFCTLPTPAIQMLETITAPELYPKGVLLCLEGHRAHGIHVLCHGSAKVYAKSAGGKTIILRIAGPGELVGLTGVISGGNYEASVETLRPTQANFVSRQDFLRFLARFPEVGMKSAQQLAHSCQCAYEEIRTLRLAGSVSDRMASLLLQWCQQPMIHQQFADGNPRVQVSSSQQEIAQMIGTSRETISRVVNQFRRNGWIAIQGSTWTILDRGALQRQRIP